MLIRRTPDIRSSEITDEQTYLRRREFMRLAGVVAAAAAGPLVAGRGDSGRLEAAAMGQQPLANVKPKVVSTDEPLNTFEQITSYNNFFEFGTGKNDPISPQAA
jgi:methionine sulfoxide reductase catalytic subunit